MVRPIGTAALIEVEIIYSCPNTQCFQLFLGYFDLPPNHNSPWKLRETRPTKVVARQFDQSIKQCSISFCDIFNEANAAVAAGLLQICGVGYRKALEFLIKDYLIKQHPDKAAGIAKAQLGACIENYISDQRMKDVAKRAVWLGNDETHYERRWVDKDLADLKGLIDLTIHWIMMEMLTASALASMQP